MKKVPPITSDLILLNKNGLESSTVNRISQVETKHWISNVATFLAFISLLQLVKVLSVYQTVQKCKYCNARTQINPIWTPLNCFLEPLTVQPLVHLDKILLIIFTFRHFISELRSDFHDKFHRLSNNFLFQSFRLMRVSFNILVHISRR